MENVLTGFVVIFIILFAALTLSDAVTKSQESVTEAWQEIDAFQGETSATDLRPTHGEAGSGGTEVMVGLYNSGGTRMSDFEQWDVFVRYYGGMTGDLSIARLSYTEDAPMAGEWGIGGIFTDAALTQAETIEPGVLNPGETLRIDARLIPGVGEGMDIEVRVASTSGHVFSTTFQANTPPVLVANEVVNLAWHDEVVISGDHLRTTDEDAQDTITYSVTSLPTEGSLAPADSFTQDDVDANRLTYTHTGGGTTDAFNVIVSDGEETIGPFTVDIAINQPPTLDVNTGTTVMPGGIVMIDPTMLLANDLDDNANELVYTLTVLPSQGNLSLSGSFTQAQIDAGMLIYYHTEAGMDHFQFTISDGKNQIGPFIFTIRLM